MAVEGQPLMAEPTERDLYAMGPESVQAPPRTLARALLQIGPGLILAGAIVGTGELIATTNLGAKAGFALLWLVIFSCFIKVFVQVELGRHAISSGQTTMQSFRQLPGPGPIVGWWWVVMMLFSQLQLGAVVGGCGQACHLVLPGVSEAIARGVGTINAGWGAYLAGRPELAWGAAIVLATVLLLARGSYRVIETGTTILVVAFTAMTILCVALLPASGHPIPWPQVGRGMTLGLPPEAIAAALAMFGITGVGAGELVAYPYWCIEKGYARKVGARDDTAAWLDRARGWLRVMRLDAWVSFIVYTLATVAFYFLGAAVLHGISGKGLPENVSGMLDVLSRMYMPVMGPKAAVWFIVIGAFAVLYSTLFAATGANTRAWVDFLRVNRIIRFDRGISRVTWIKWFCIAFPILDFVLFALLKNPVQMVIVGGIAQALTLPLLGGAAVYLRYRQTDRRLRPGMLWDLLLWLSVASLTVAAGIGVWNEASKMR